MKPERRTFIEWAKEEVPEPRVASLVTYPLTEILFVVFVGVLCGTEDIDEIALFARMNLELAWRGGVVAIDGKSLRGTSEGQPHDAVHTISAFAHTNGFVHGQRCVEGKSNEITAIPALLEQLFLDEAIVRID